MVEKNILGNGFSVPLENIQKRFPDYAEFYLITQDKFKSHQGKMTHKLHAAVSICTALINEIKVPLYGEKFEDELTNYLDYLKGSFGEQVINSLINEFNFKLPRTRA